MGSIALGVMVLAFVSAPAQDADVVAAKLLADGAEAFNSKDAAAMAASFTDDAEITLFTQDEGAFQTLSYSGKERIRQLYQDLFSNSAQLKAKNVVEYARYVGPNLMLIAGTFEPEVGGSIILQFVQIRTRGDDGQWRIRKLQLFQIPAA